jgi:hypothetical protein
VRMYDNHDAPNDALFSLGNVSKIRSRLAEACEWDAASTSSGNAAPNAPAPAAAPRCAQGAAEIALDAEVG